MIQGVIECCGDNVIPIESAQVELTTSIGVTYLKEESLSRQDYLICLLSFTAAIAGAMSPEIFIQVGILFVFTLTIAMVVINYILDRQIDKLNKIIKVERVRYWRIGDY